MRGALGSPRLLLRRLREVMAEPVSAQERLDRTVVVIASNMVAEVCSVYILRIDGTLELYATEGLNPEAVHLTTMRAGEGLVGLIAREAEPLALSDAQSHPAFSYRPETGEEIYHGFLGVPILRTGNTLGVLVVQNRTNRVYTEEEIEALQTTSMVLAEMIASGELQEPNRFDSDLAVRRPLHLNGASLADGVGLGHAVLHAPRVVVKNLLSDDPEHELERIDTAIKVVRDTIDRLVEEGDIAHHGEHRDVLETVRMFANDQGWMRRVREAVTTGLTAEAAVERVQSDVRARMLRQTDPYLRDRLHDLDELSERLLHALAGEHFGASRGDLPENAILIARSMGPAALLDYDRSRLRGLVLEEGGPASHIAIVARALGIPAVGEVAGVTGLVEAGDAIIIDGGAADIHLRPQPDVEAAYAEKARLRAKRQEQYRSLRSLPSLTVDGETIKLGLNAGLLVDLSHVTETNADGIGLFRTELQFMIAERLPSTGEQETLYRQVLDEMNGSPVTFRTLDIGGDKVLPYMQTVEEENPALGWRAIRIGLDRPGLLRAQVRALLKAGAGRDLRIMFPMVATVEEFNRAKAIVTREESYLRKHGHALPRSLSVGVMIEVPSLLFQIDELVRVADFLCVGSNDLMQFMFAADRENRQVSERFDPLSAPMLRALKLIQDSAAALNRPVTLCGEIGGKPLEAMALVGLGYRSFSMSAASIGPVKAMVLSLDAGAITAEMERLLAHAGDRGTLRSALASFAAAKGVPV